MSTEHEGSFQQVSLDQAIKMVESEPDKGSTALVAVHTKLEAIRDTRAVLDEFILDAVRFSEESEQSALAAEEFTVDSEAASQVADTVQASLKVTLSQRKDRRLALTRSLDDLKSAIMQPEKPGIELTERAIALYQSKISKYRAAVKAQAAEAQRNAERLLREDRERKEAEARRLEEKAAKLKTPAAQERAKQEAEEIRQVAAMMPESVALSASAPQTVASNVAEIWDVEKIEDASAFLKWLADHPEWHKVLDYNKRPMMQLADQWHALGVPGIKFHQRDQFRSKSR